MRKRIPILLTYSLLLALTGCKKEEIAIDPREAILGKWELSHFGTIPIEEPSGYEEYLPDSVHVSYFYDEEVPYTSKYWFNDSLLFISTIYNIAGGDETVTFTLEYKFEFLTKDNLKLKLKNLLATETRSKYRRIN